MSRGLKYAEVNLTIDLGQVTYFFCFSYLQFMFKVAKLKC